MSARRLVLLAGLLAGCFPDVDYAGTTYRCSDGQTCPGGFTCVERVCRASLPGGEPDAAPGADGAPAAPDAGPIATPTVAVAAGDFTRGCEFLGNGNCSLDTIPSATVTLSAYRIDQHEVTQAAYQACVASGRCALPAAHFDPAVTPDRPVTDVSWDQADGYCRFAGGRLPSEAEWEKAARGTDARTYPWGETAPDCARVSFMGCSGAPADVGSHSDDASPFGATEMAGNVAEWVADRYSPSYYAMGPTVDPSGPASGNERSIRGGGFDSTEPALRTYVRDHAVPETTRASLGFRCAR